MATIKIHAGDFPKGDCQYYSSIISFPWTWGDGLFGKKLDLRKELQHVEVANEESVKKWGGTIGWGAVGGALLGPVGLLAGLLLGGKKKEVTFIAVMKDGKKILATTDSKTYTSILSLAFK
ncbi:hypothetical protein C2134_02925 [Chromobacterium sinusclupearum]|uniref:Uncharacterized protein n=1 Tax=Chromobacterium sinusclupearum TaxID=2077146 RepID=A0A2K4MSS5_9NEIS|nr:hypothetical protein [Chromobacterium sinusclupearum]POB00162.1 hypothetical protein C2134_02925 [Chromobacterium sinusclupearum]